MQKVKKKSYRIRPFCEGKYITIKNNNISACLDFYAISKKKNHVASIS